MKSSNNEKKEWILCAAIWYRDGKKHEAQPRNIESGFVIAGRRHHNCYATAKALCGGDRVQELKLENIENTMTREEYKDHQGFITSLDRYVNRQEAYEIARANNQIKLGDGEVVRELKTLISEHLY